MDPPQPPYRHAIGRHPPPVVRRCNPEWSGCTRLHWLVLDHYKPSPGYIAEGLPPRPRCIFTNSGVLLKPQQGQTLQEYCLGIKIFRILISDSLLQQQKPSLVSAVISNLGILSQEIFLPVTINLIDLCAALFVPPFTWTPPFGFFPPLPTKVTPPVATHNLPHTLLTTVPPSSVVSTVFAKFLSATPQPLSKMMPVRLKWRALLLCYLPLADGKNSYPFPISVLPIHHTSQDASIQVPLDACILSPLHETFDALLRSKNSLEVSTSMTRRFELSC